MTNYISAQTIELLFSAILGCGIGVLFDAFRVLRTFLPQSRVTTAILDVVFWIIATLALFTFILTVSEGRMRAYVLFGVFCGGFVYMSALSHIVFKVLLAVIRTVRKLLSLATYPIYAILRSIWHLFMSSGCRVEAYIRKKFKGGRLKKNRKAGKNGDKKDEKTQKLFS